MLWCDSHGFESRELLGIGCYLFRSALNGPLPPVVVVGVCEFVHSRFPFIDVTQAWQLKLFGRKDFCGRSDPRFIRPSAVLHVCDLTFFPEWVCVVSCGATFGITFLLLAAVAVDGLTIRGFTSHLRLEHLCLDQAVHCNPLLQSTYADEDFVGKVKKLALRSSPTGLSYQVLLRYVAYTCCRWLRRLG